MKFANFDEYQARPPETIPLPADYWADHGETAVYWLSAAGVLVNCRGVNVMIDPVLALSCDDPATSEIGELLLAAPPILASQVQKLDAVLYTHTDSDHLAPVTARELLRTGARYHGPAAVDGELERLGVPRERRARHGPGETFEVGGLRITTTPAFHSYQLARPDFTGYFGPEDCCGYRIDTPDGTLWVPGDTKLLPEHLKMEGVDLLFIDFGDDCWHFGLDGAVALANVLEGAELVMFHYGTFYAPHSVWHNADPRSVEGRLRRPERLHAVAPGKKLTLHHNLK